MLNKQIFLIFTFATFLTLTCLASGEEITPPTSTHAPIASPTPVTNNPTASPSTVTFHARVSATTTAVAAKGEMISFQAIADCGPGNVAISGSQSCTFTAIDGQSPIGSCPTQHGTTPATCETETGALTRYWLGSCIAGPIPASLTVFATCMPASAVMPMPLPIPMPIAPLQVNPSPMIPATAPTPAAAPIPATALTTNSVATQTAATETAAEAQASTAAH